MENNAHGYPVVIENSPIEFALMGPNGRHRGVLVKSSQASLDLIAYDSPIIDFFATNKRKGTPSYLTLDDFLLSPTDKSNIYVVRSADAELPGLDSRKSFYSFAWKGLCTKRDLDEFENQFQLVTADLNAVLKSENKSEVEWSISGLIASCQLMKDRATRQRKLFKLITLSYVIVFFASAIWLSFIWRRIYI